MTKPTRKRPNTKSFEADPDVEEALQRAIAAGATLKELANEALRKQLPSVLREQAKKLRERADQLEKNAAVGKR